MTKLKLKTSDVVYTELSVSEIRSYLFGGSKTGSIQGYTSLDKTEPVLIAVHAIVLVYQ